MSDILEKKCKWLNETKGDLHHRDGYYCSLCHNKGQVFFIRGDDVVARRCQCLRVRKSMRLIAKSGLADAIQKKTFDSFVVTENWQKAIKDKALLFLKNDVYKTFFVGGQPGSGKTHICTALCGELLKRARQTLYLLWTRDARELKACANEMCFSQKMDEYKEAEVLYIDDFLKVMRGASPTPADINIAFELLNSRLLDPDKITIISSEFTIEELLRLDEGTASRICERTGPFALNISRASEKDYRLRSAKR